MELPFQIEAQNGALSFVDLLTEKEIQEKGNTASKNDVLENWFIVDIRRLARERWLDARTGAVTVLKSRGAETLQRFKVESDSDFLYEAAQTTKETKAT